MSMLDILERLPEMCREAVKIGNDIKTKEFDKIMVTGMGGSALPGEILKCYLADIKMPVFVSKAYSLPAFANRNTLVFAVSYSGNTEETLSSFDDALKKNVQLYAISSGGGFEKKAKENSITHIKVPAGIQPRNAIPYVFFPLLNMLKNAAVIKQFDDEFNEMVTLLKSHNFKKLAQDTAEKLHNKIPLIYSSERFFPVAYKWKINFNENTKTMAFCNALPEMNHNEINGFQFMSKNIIPIFLKNKNDHQQTKRRMEITKKLIGAEGIDIEMEGGGLLANIFSTIHTGDLVSYYLAEKYGIDPESVEVVERLKRELKSESKAF